jgi:putative peptidoglycan lipid II flippase
MNVTGSEIEQGRQPEQVAPARRKLAWAAFGVSASSALNIVLGFAFQVALAALFGAGRDMDAFLAASTIPNILVLVLTGALSITFVPVFVEYEVRGQGDEAWTVVAGCLYLCGGFLVALSASLAILARPIIALTAPGFAPGSPNFELTVELFLLMLPSVAVTGVASLLRSYYHARRHFFLAAAAPLVNSLVLLAASLALAPLLGIRAVAVATLLGSLAQLLLLAPAVWRRELALGWGAVAHPGVRRVLLLMLPWVSSAIFYKSNILIDRFLASQLDIGAISALGYAYRLMTAISQVLTQGLSMVLFPLMAEHVAAGDMARLRAVAAQGIRLTILLALPAVVMLLTLGVPIVRLLFERGQFDLTATALTAQALSAYMGAFFAGAVGSVLTYVFYASQRTGIVALVGVCGFVINILAAVAATPRFGVAGPALAYSLAGFLNLLLLVWILHRQLEGLGLRETGVATLKIVAALLPACLLWAWAGSWLGVLSLGTLASAVTLGGVLLVGLGAFLALCLALRVQELQFVSLMVRRRLRGRRVASSAESP